MRGGEDEWTSPGSKVTASCTQSDDVNVGDPDASLLERVCQSKQKRVRQKGSQGVGLRHSTDEAGNDRGGKAATQQHLIKGNICHA